MAQPIHPGDPIATKLVTITTTMNAAEAQFVVNRLNDAGIDAVIADENFVTMDFLLGNAAGWIKVQVREQDAERAVDVLEAHDPPIDEKEIPWDQPPAEEDDDEEATVEERAKRTEERTAPVEVDPAAVETEALLSRAYRCAIIGLFCFPPILNLFSLAMLSEVRKSRSLFTDESSRKYSIAKLVDYFAILTFGWFWVWLVAALAWDLGKLFR